MVIAQAVRSWLSSGSASIPAWQHSEGVCVYKVPGWMMVMRSGFMMSVMLSQVSSYSGFIEFAGTYGM